MIIDHGYKALAQLHYISPVKKKKSVKLPLFSYQSVLTCVLSSQKNIDMVLSALDKILGQLGTYATWLSSIAYLQKQLRIFIFFMPHFFSVITPFSYCMKPSGMCLHIYSLPSSAFLKYQTRGFYCS